MVINLNLSEQNTSSSLNMSPNDIEWVNGEGEIIKIWGYILLYKNNPFSNDDIPEDLQKQSFDHLIPLLTGSFIAASFDENAKLKNFSVDFGGHKRAYIYHDKIRITISDDLSKFNFGKEIEFDEFQINHFLQKGYTWFGGTFVKNLSILSPSAMYAVEDNDITRKLLDFPRITNDKESIDSVCANIMKSLLNKGIGLMFSGGVDSTFIREVAYNNQVDIKSFMCHIIEPSLKVVAEDIALANALEKGRKDIEYVRLENVFDLMDETLEKTMSLLPFEFHISAFQLFIIKHAKAEGLKLIITGQNADSMYNYGSTSDTSIGYTIRRLLSGHIHGANLTILFNRYLQTGRVLENIRRGNPNWLVRKVWRFVNPNVPLTIHNVILSFLMSDSQLPTLISSELSSKDDLKFYEEYYKQTEELVSLLNKGETPRMLLLRSKLLGHCQGRDVRCITEWAKQEGIINMQLFTSAPIISWFGHNNLTLKDVFHPKMKLRKYIDKYLNYTKTKANVLLHITESDYLDERQYFNKIYEKLNSDGKMSVMKRKAIEFLRKKGFSESITTKSDEELHNTNTDFRLVWMINTINNLIDHCS